MSHAYKYLLLLSFILSAIIIHTTSKSATWAPADLAVTILATAIPFGAYKIAARAANRAEVAISIKRKTGIALLTLCLVLALLALPHLTPASAHITHCAKASAFYSLIVALNTLRTHPRACSSLSQQSRL